MNNLILKWASLNEKEKIDLLKDGVATDCSFIVGSNQSSEVIRCHQAILSQASEVFNKMLTKNAGEDLTDIKIHLDNVEANTVQEFAYFIYFGDKEKMNKLSLQILQELVYLGENYKIKELSDVCLKAIENSVVSLRDIANFYEFADRVDNKKLIDLLNRKKNDWCKNVKREQNDIYCSSIYDMNTACFMDFIKVFSSENVKHSFEMVEYYIKKNLSDNTFDDGNKEKNLINPENYLKIDKNDLKNLEDISNESEDNHFLELPKGDFKNDEATPKNVELDSKESKFSLKDGSINREDCNFEASGTVDSKNNKGDSEEQQQVTSSPSSSVDKKISNNNNKFIINMLLNLIDFKRMTLIEFLNGPVNSDLLDVNMRLETLAIIVPKDR